MALLSRLFSKQNSLGTKIVVRLGTCGSIVGGIMGSKSFLEEYLNHNEQVGPIEFMLTSTSGVIVGSVMGIPAGITSPLWLSGYTLYKLTELRKGPGMRYPTK